MVADLRGQPPGFSTAAPVVRVAPAMAAVAAEPAGPPHVPVRPLSPGDQPDCWQSPSGQPRLPAVQMSPKLGCCPVAPKRLKPESHYFGNQTQNDQLPCQPVAVAVGKQEESRRERRRCNWPALAHWRRRCRHLQQRGCLAEHPTNPLLGCRIRNHPGNHPEDSPAASPGQQHPARVHQSGQSQACLASGTREAHQAAFVGKARSEKPAQ